MDRRGRSVVQTTVPESLEIVMTRAHELWRLEEQFWTGDAAFYERSLAPDALMVLPAPAGILGRTATVESIRSAPRWRNVSFTQRHHVAPGTDIVVLAYHVRADRGDEASSYAAQCSSTYVRTGGDWRLVLHHQSAAGDGEAAVA